MSVEQRERPVELDLPSRQPLAGRTCLVTGASRGIGRGIASELGRHGATVIVNYRSSEAAAHEVVDAITEADTEGMAHPVQADITDRDEVNALRETVQDSFGPINVLVNNAGITCDCTLTNMDHDDWHQVIDVSLHGAFNCTKAFYDDFTSVEEGRVINISSVIGKQGNVGQANYAAAKSGLFGFTRSLALELADTGATANCIAPGFTLTEMVESIPDEIQDDLRADIPLERFANVSEIAGLVRYLASEESSYITGEVIDINGGLDL